MLALTKLRLELIIIFLPLIAVAEPISETEWSRCAAVKDDRERLVCFDGITLKQRSTQPDGEDKSSEVLDDIVHRCRAQMGSYGSTMVKACVDQDLDAYRAMEQYPVEHAPMVDRCKQQMGSFGWSMVKACADQDIEAERALRGMGQQ